MKISPSKVPFTKLVESNPMAHTEQLTNNEPTAIIPTSTMNGTNDTRNYTQRMVDEPDHFDDDEDFLIAQDSLEHIDVQHTTIQSIHSSRGSSLSINSINGSINGTINGNKNKNELRNGDQNGSVNKKSGKHILEFETGNAEDPWKDDIHHIDHRRSVTNLDYQPPCPVLSNKCPYCFIVCCCCCWSNYDRQQCSLALLYTKLYFGIYLLSIVITIALLIYDLSNGSIIDENLDKEPIWFISLDIFCVGLMVFDIIIQILAYLDKKKFFKSILNIFDFIIVAICVISIPIYWVAPDWILSIVLLSRFIVRMLRIITVIRHQKMRKEYISARDAIVDFTKFNEQNNINQAANNTIQQFL